MSAPARWSGLAAVSAALACAPPGGFDRQPRAAPLFEHVTPRIPASPFRVIALVANDSRSPRRMSHTVAERLRHAGVATPSVPGRWSSQNGAIKELCAGVPPAVDGVLFVSSTQLELRDCVTGTTAYEVRQARADVTALTERLLQYLRRTAATDTPSDSAARAP